MWETYGLGVKDAQENAANPKSPFYRPGRQITLIHRAHQADLKAIVETFKALPGSDRSGADSTLAFSFRVSPAIQSRTYNDACHQPDACRLSFIPLSGGAKAAERLARPWHSIFPIRRLIRRSARGRCPGLKKRWHSTMSLSYRHIPRCFHR